MALTFNEWLSRHEGGTRLEYAEYLSAIARSQALAMQGKAADSEFTLWFEANRAKLRLPWPADSLQAAWEAGRRAGQAGPVLGSELIDGAGPDATCGCGYGITYFEGAWLHVFNPELTGTDDHDAEPGDPDDVDWSDYEDDSEEGDNDDSPAY